MNKRQLTTNVVWNFLGNTLPLVVGVFALPFLIGGFGVQRFGVLTIAWALIGYFSLFDMGLGRALTQLVAERLGHRAQGEVPSLVSTTLLLMWGLGVLGAIVVWLLSAWLAQDILAMPPTLRVEARDTFRVLALSIPFVVATAGLRGVLEAHQRFGMISMMRMVLGVVTFVGPLVVLPFSGNLAHAVGVLVIMRMIIWWGHSKAVRMVVQVRPIEKVWDPRFIRPLFSFGGWMTVTNIVGPMMMYMDRFIIGSLISVAAVAYYTTPYEVVTKFFVVPAALSGVLFPAFSAHWNSAPERAARLVERGSVYTLAALFPILLVVALFARELLQYWLGAEFAKQGTLVVQWLAAGILINSVAQIIFALLQGAGRSDWTAKIHLAELLPYGLMLWFFLTHFGIAGAAAAWFLRAAVDALIMMVMATRLNAAIKSALQEVMYMSVVATGVILSAMFLENMGIRLLIFSLSMTLYLPLVWHRMLGVTERDWLRNLMNIKRG